MNATLEMHADDSRPEGAGGRTNASPIVVTLTQRADGTDAATAEHGGMRFVASSRHGATMKLARELVAAGVADGPLEARGSDGRVRFKVRSLYALAGVTIQEGEGRAHVVPFVPKDIGAVLECRFPPRGASPHAPNGRARSRAPAAPRTRPRASAAPLTLADLDL